jgi:prepilin-type processing-associated H-X9-DG protein
LGCFLPAVQKVRDAALRMQCSNNLKQIALGCHNFVSTMGYFPEGDANNYSIYSNQPWFSQYATAYAQYYGPSDPNGGLSGDQNWRVLLLPYIEQNNLFTTYQTAAAAYYNSGFNDSSGFTNGGVNSVYGEGKLKVFICPACPAKDNHMTVTSYAGQSYYYGMSCYVGNGGTDDPDVNDTWPVPPKRNGMFEYNTKVNPIHVTDGTSNTWLMAERYHFDPVFDSFSGDAPGQGIDGWGYWFGSSYDAWIYPTVAVNYLMPKSDLGISDPQQWSEQYKRLNSMGSGHTGGCNAALADGSVRFVNQSISVSTIISAATRNGGEVLGTDF